MFSGIKMEEYMEPELSGIFWVKIVAKKTVLRSPGTHFMYMMVNKGSKTLKVLKHLLCFFFMVSTDIIKFEKNELKILPSCSWKFRLWTFLKVPK